MSTAGVLLLSAHTVATVAMVALIWFVQIARGGVAVAMLAEAAS